MSTMDELTVRLAVTTAMTSSTDSAKFRYPHLKENNGVTVRLAHIDGAQGDNNLIGQRGVEQISLEMSPPLLVSYYYLKPFLEKKHLYNYRDWVMDSGAFSAHSMKVKIDLQKYIETCKELLATDKKLTEVFSLDVIGDHKQSLINTEEMWRQGVPAIPCFHVGEPQELLIYLAKTYPKIALGGAVGFKGKDHWAAQCFSRVWPKKIHGFGYGGKPSIMALPWHSVDATNWETGPCKFGRWNAFGKLSVRGSKQNLKSEILFYRAVEIQARKKWAGAMKQLDNAEMSVRLAECGTGKREGRLAIEGLGEIVTPRREKK